MLVLRLTVFVMVLIVLVGVLVLCAVTLPIGMNNFMGMLGSAIVGTLLSVPVTYFIAKKMSEGMKI